MHKVSEDGTRHVAQTEAHKHNEPTDVHNDCVWRQRSEYLKLAESSDWSEKWSAADETFGKEDACKRPARWTALRAGRALNPLAH
jgi:hypothetical protein